MKRVLIIAASAIAVATVATPAAAQNMGNRQALTDGRWTAGADRPGSDRWNATVDGRWYAGWDAPGGWNGYRPLRRGAHLPPYWFDTRFRVPNYTRWNLAAPAYGFFWFRYYDDAVLVDRDGQVWDSVSGVPWGGASASASSSAYAYSGAQARAGSGYYYESPGGGNVPPAAAPPAVQYRQGCGCNNGYYGQGGGYVMVPTTTVVVVQGAPSVTTTTTTTTTTVEEVYETHETYYTTETVRAPAPAPAPRRIPERGKLMRR
ncbi:RcnB family protein [Stakelama tenebrarum]|uniref:RcnB family protein n=1 Tax=Stakelama tenebrarum TaxID=2711215 RepID=A0A6G6Y906_9SPHN|nr:RcnB family protein [Sphingosinithalassobacter tenebrarum]QIG81287.1 RcnB family protein [Sphingosinithalassobacter tenebrarum]